MPRKESLTTVQKTILREMLENIGPGDGLPVDHFSALSPAKTEWARQNWARSPLKSLARKGLAISERKSDGDKDVWRITMLGAEMAMNG